MCYSVASSLKTSMLSLVSILILLSSGIPHFQWIGCTLIGWCMMQFAELCLWLTEPNKACTEWNEIITLTLIPIVLMMQPLGTLWGSLYEIPWNQSSIIRKQIMIFYSIYVVLAVCWAQFYKIDKTCTTVTPKGHLNWLTRLLNKYSLFDYFIYFIWGFIILFPFLLFWNKSFIPILLLTIIPFFAFMYGLYTDGKPSIWCYYTSYSSVVAILLLIYYKVT